MEGWKECPGCRGEGQWHSPDNGQVVSCNTKPPLTKEDWLSGPAARISQEQLNTFIGKEFAFPQPSTERAILTAATDEGSGLVRVTVKTGAFEIVDVITLEQLMLRTTPASPPTPTLASEAEETEGDAMLRFFKGK